MEASFKLKHLFLIGKDLLKNRIIWVCEDPKQRQKIYKVLKKSDIIFMIFQHPGFTWFSQPVFKIDNPKNSLKCNTGGACQMPIFESSKF